VDRYSTKRTLLRPLTAWRRHRAQRLGSINVPVWEAMDYRPSMRTFFHAMRADPDLLITADLPSGAVALDLGAFEGEWSRRLLARADTEGVEDLRIHAFEPEPGAVDHLLATVGQDPRVVIHPFGLAGRDRREPLSIGGPGSSVFDNPSVPSALGVTEIDLRDIDAVLGDLGVDRVDFVKINIEGGEFEVLDRLHASGWLARTGTLIVQFHEFAPGAHRARRRNRRQLAETHRCTWNHAWIYERWDPR
jgi:FkbM family methyltransferase